MAEDTATDATPINDAELHDALVNLDFISVRFKGMLKLADKINKLRALLQTERELGDRVAAAQGRLDAANATIAAGEAAQKRLDNISSEIDDRLKAGDAQAAQIVQAGKDKSDLLIDLTKQAIAEEKQKAADDIKAAADHDAAEVAARQAKLNALGAEIDDRQSELDEVNRSLDDVRKMIGAR
jgi:chromosome segregation ATPase